MENMSSKILNSLNEAYYPDRYLNPEGILDDIKNLIEEAKEKVGVKDEDLVDGGAIFYMNGNDSTPFDWSANGRTCEFMCFYKDNEMGMAKCWVNKKGELIGYYYTKEDIQNGIEIKNTALADSIDEDTAADFAYLCARVADDNKLWDTDITKIPWNDEKVASGTGKYYLGDE